MAPPPRRKRAVPEEEPMGPTTEPSMPAVGPDAGDTDEQPAVGRREEDPPVTASSTDELMPPRALVRRARAERERPPPERERVSGANRAPVRNSRRIPVGREAERKRRSPLLALLFLAVLGVGAAVVWEKLQPKPQSPVKLDENVQAAQVLFQEGKNLVRKGQWKLAEQKFDEAAALAPALEGLKGYLEARKVEVPLQEHLDAAAQALDKSEVARAARELAQVPETTQQLSRRQELHSRLNKVADQRLKDAQRLTSDRTKMRELKALAEDVLAARPNDRDAQQLLETANRALGWRPPVEKPPPPGDPAGPVMSLWAEGDSTGAFAKAEECAGQSARCARLKEQITRATPLVKKLEALDGNELLDLVRLDRALTGGPPSPSGKQAGVRLAAVLTPQASSAAARKQWGAAMAVARKILEGDPGNTAAKNIMRDGRDAAEELFKRCYVGRQSSPEEALPLCREVVEMLPDGDELRTKAQKLLDKGRSE